MAIDEGQIARDALSAWAAEAHATLLGFAKAYPAVFRRGVQGFLEEPVTGRQRTRERTLLEALANQDPAAYDAEIMGRLQATSFQEVVELLGSGRLRQEQG